MRRLRGYPQKKGERMRFACYFFCAFLFFGLALSGPQAVAQEEMIKTGKKVKFDYILKVAGEEIANSQKSGPVEYTCGNKQIVPGLERQMEGLKAGDKRTFMVAAQEAYGQVDAAAFKEVPKTALPADLEPKVGQILSVRDVNGNSFPVVISEVKDDKVILNFNHPLAGKELQFEVTILEVK